MSEKIVLIDGNSIMNRAFYGVPDLTNAKGLHTNAVYGFLNIMFKIIGEEAPDYLVVAFDVHKPTFRHIRYSEYKGTRKPMPPQLKEQMPLIHQVLEAMGIVVVEKAGYEADDILGTIAVECEKNGMSVSLVSGDRDLLQIATDNIKIRIPKTKGSKTEIEDYNTKDVVEKYSLMPKQIIDLKGLMGDASDNIPGAPGIGEKTATKILLEYSTVENALENASVIKPPKASKSLMDNKELVLLSKELATIKTDCELDVDISKARIDNIYNDDSIKLFNELGFKSILAKAGSKSTNKEQKDIVIKTYEAYVISDVLDQLEALVEKHNDIGFSAVYKKDYSFLEEDYLFFSFENEVLDILVSEKNKKYFKEFIEDIIKRKDKRLCVNDLKRHLYYFDGKDNDNILDVQIAAYLLSPTDSEYDYSYVAGRYLERVFPTQKNMLDEVGKKASEDAKLSALKKAAIYDAFTCANTGDVLVSRLKSECMYDLFLNIEMPLVYTLHEMQVRGIKVNKEELNAYAEKLLIRIKELEKEIYESVGEEFNINSPKQLGIILFEKLNLPFGKKTKTGYSTSAEMLDKLRCEHEVVNKILEYRQLTKLHSTYAVGLVPYILEDGRIRSTFNQTVTATGRISSTEPNLQNIPIRDSVGREIRKVFIPEDGYVFVDADYSQIELRVLAHMSDDERLIEAYGMEEDIHKITASQVFNVPLEQVTKELRSRAKAVNFGIIYGMSSFGLGQDLNISRVQAQEYIDSYFKTYPNIKMFLDKLVEDAKENGFSTTMFNRKRTISELNSSNYMQRMFGERIAMNSPIQGSAADIIKIAMIRVNTKLKEKGYKSRLILQIHDELLIETHESEVDEVMDIVTSEMKNAVSLKVALGVEAKWGKNWLDAH